MSSATDDTNISTLVIGNLGESSETLAKLLGSGHATVLIPGPDAAIDELSSRNVRLALWFEPGSHAAAPRLVAELNRRRTCWVVVDRAVSPCWRERGAWDHVQSVSELSALMDLLRREWSLERECADLREELRRSLGLEAVARLAGDVAHDFNNLITTVSCFASFIDETAKDPSVSADVQEIMFAVDRGTLLTERLFSLSHRRRNRRSALSLTAVLMDLRRFITEASGHHSRVHIDSGVDVAPIFFNRGDLEQALLHTVIHARDRTSDRGCLVLRSRQRDGHVELEIEDDGGRPIPDFTPDSAEAIDAYRSELTLKSVKRLLESGGASLETECRAGGGYIYRFRLPVYCRELHPLLTPKHARGQYDQVQVNGGGDTAIILEFDDGVARSLTRLLESYGFRAERAISFREIQRGLRQQRWEHPRLVLINEIALTGGTADELMLMAPSVDVIVLSATASGAANDSHGVLELPFNEGDLLDALRRIHSESLKGVDEACTHCQ